MDEAQTHAFKINFSFEKSSHTALLTILQKEDHDEYRVVPDEEVYLKKYGSQTIDNYFGQKDPLRCQHVGNEYTEAIINGVQEFLNAKHS